jgi:ABC-type oligopeptide transport system substrate-binding subunit
MQKKLLIGAAALLFIAALAIAVSLPAGVSEAQGGYYFDGTNTPYADNHASNQYIATALLGKQGLEPFTNESPMPIVIATGFLTSQPPPVTLAMTNRPTLPGPTVHPNATIPPWFVWPTEMRGR